MKMRKAKEENCITTASMIAGSIILFGIKPVRLSTLAK